MRRRRSGTLGGAQRLNVADDNTCGPVLDMTSGPYRKSGDPHRFSAARFRGSLASDFTLKQLVAYLSGQSAMDPLSADKKLTIRRQNVSECTNLYIEVTPLDARPLGLCPRPTVKVREARNGKGYEGTGREKGEERKERMEGREGGG